MQTTIWLSTRNLISRSLVFFHLSASELSVVKIPMLFWAVALRDWIGCQLSSSWCSVARFHVSGACVILKLAWELTSKHTVMSLLEAPCAKTSWRALLFRAILGITRALIVCFDTSRFKQANNSETGYGGHHCDFGQHVPWLSVHVCMNSVKFVLEAPGASILWGRYYSVTVCRLTWGRFY